MKKREAVNYVTKEDLRNLPKELMVQLKRDTYAFGEKTKNILSIIQEAQSDIDRILIRYYRKFGVVISRYKTRDSLSCLVRNGFVERTSMRGVYRFKNPKKRRSKK